MIYVGTSGFSYDDWVGPFYPEGLAPYLWLSYYARHFKACELNFTYYRQPDRSTLKGLARRVPKGFLFTVKAYQGITHSREATDADFREFLAGIEPLAQEGKLGCILAQFPYSFVPLAGEQGIFEGSAGENGRFPTGDRVSQCQVAHQGNF
jgi:uncharacterized protein YecE (DUF72 family)